MDQKEYLHKANKIYEAIEEAHERQLTFWFEHVIFTWQWWLEVFLTVAPWVLWLFFRKKESTKRLLLSGLTVMIISSWLDFVGITLGLWHYNYDILPLLPSYSPWDFTLIPVIIMALIQFKHRSNPLIKAIIFAGGSAFIGEPFFSFIRTYSPDHWKYIYSFPFLFSIYLVGHYISKGNKFEKL